MPLKISCPAGHVLTVPRQRAGRMVRCPICEQEVLVPQPEPSVLLERPGRQTAGVSPSQDSRHHRQQRRTVDWLGAGLALLALTSLYPAIREIVASAGAEPPRSLAIWVYLVLLLGAIQAVYVLYLVQLPDWSTTWVLTVVTVIVATIYAAGLGISVTAGRDNSTIDLLGLADQQLGGQMAGWCLVMLSLTVLASYAFYRVTIRWRKVEMLMRENL